MILGTGELVVDCFREKEGLVARAGGAPFNALAGVALLGGEASFYGSVGDDSLGTFMEGEARRLPFKDLLIERKPGRMTTWTEVEERHGDRSFFFHRENGADYLLSFESFKPLLLKKPSIVHLGSLMLPFEEGQAFIRETVNYKKGHPALRLSFDVNYREGLFPEGEEGKKLFLTIIDSCDVAKLTHEELSYLTSEEKVAAAVRKLAAPGRLLAITMGSRGSYFYLDGKEALVPPKRVVSPVDTTGAGDAFMAYLLYALDGKDLHGVSYEELVDVFYRANACGALATLKKGAIASFPSQEELEAYLS